MCHSPRPGEPSECCAADRRFGLWEHRSAGQQGDVDYEVVEGDLLEQSVDATVNAWNRNVIPWWFRNAIAVADARGFLSVVFL